MTEPILMLGVAFLTGLVLGVVFFGGLWLTLQHFTRWRHPGLWVSLSLLLRTVVTVGGLYLVFDDQWQRLLVALAGFLLVRGVFRRRIAAPLKVRTEEG
jgi:F1F0 ATPase subunit 2